jgi:outer membrane protein assembly factor BamB
MRVPRWLAAAWLLLIVGRAPADEPAATSLGAPQFIPTAEHPVGWRGDGTGRYPAAQPPTTWHREQAGDNQTLSNIPWMTPLPNVGVSSPIVVGNRIFLTCEPADVVCLDKQSGHILWIRSIPEFEAIPEATRSANPGYAQTLAPLSAELAAMNDKMVAELNTPAPTASVKPPPARAALLQKKRDIEKQIIKEEVRIDKKRFTHNWAQAVFGYTGATPTSDGERVCAFLTTGVTVCYTLQGKRQWIAGGEGGGSEHGNFASPLLCDNRVIVWANELRAYDKLTGALAWTTPAKAFNTYGSLFRAKSGGDSVACFQWGFFTRVRDGAAIWDQGAFGDSVTTPIVEDGKIFAWVGYPHGDREKKGFRAFPIPPNTSGGKLVDAYRFDTDWGADEMPIDDKKNPFDRFFVASPLYVDGLIYQVNQGGGLIVNDAATGEQVYRKVLPLKPRTEYWNWAGCGASPTLAGKFIYLYDNQGTTIVIRPGRKYDQVAINMVEEWRENKEREQNLATPVFDGSRMYYRTPGFLYCIGGK